MNDFLSASLNGAIFILVVLLLRTALKRHLPRTAFAVLWLIAIFRLLCPVKIPFAGSFWNLTGQDASDAETSAIPAGAAGASLQESTAESWSFLQTTWAVVAACLLGAVAVLYVRSLMEGRKAKQIERGVYVCKDLVSPRACGILRPRILLPADMNPDLLPYVLLHERIHVRRLDNLWKLLAFIAASIHWFNPAAWILVVLLGRDVEVSCDEWVLRGLGREQRSDYALSLIDIAERYERRSPLASGFSRNPLEERIRCIMTRKNSIAAISAAAVMILGATAVFATDTPADKAAAAKAGAEKETATVSPRQVENEEVMEKCGAWACTAQEYETYMAAETERLKKQVAEGSLSQKDYDQRIKEMKETLKGLKDGTAEVFLLKTEDGNGYIACNGYVEYADGESAAARPTVELRADADVNVSFYAEQENTDGEEQEKAEIKGDAENAASASAE